MAFQQHDVIRVSAAALAVGLHVATGLLLFQSRPVGDIGPAAVAGDPAGTLYVQLLPKVSAAAASPASASPSPAETGQKQAPAEQTPTDTTGSGSAKAAPPAPDESATATVATAPAPVGGPAASDMTGTDAARFRDLLLAHIECYQHYPAEAQRDRKQGTVWLHFVMDRNGQVLRVWVDRSSGQPALDDEAVAAVRRAEPLPAIPAGLPDRLNVVLPVAFALG